MDPIYEVVDYNHNAKYNMFFASISDIKPHWHREVEFLYVCSGKLAIETEQKKYVFSHGDIIFINSNEIHAQKYIEENSVFILQIDPSMFKKFKTDIKGKYYICNSIECISYQELAALDQMKSLFIKILSKILNNDKAGDLKIGAIVHNIILCFVNTFELTAIPVEDLDTKETNASIIRLRRMFQFIDDNYNKDISIRDLAEIEYLSPSYIAHFLREKAGITFSRYLNHIRIKKVKMDLLETDDSIQDIYERHGFESQNSFNRIFKKEVGCSPTEFRANKSNIQYNKEKLLLALDNTLNTPTGTYMHMPQQLAGELPGSMSDNTENITQTEYMRKSENDISVLADYIADGKRYNKIWRKIIGGGRAREGLSRSWQRHLSMVQEEIGFEYIRLHGMLCDDMAVLSKDYLGNIKYNFSYIDELYDFLLSVNIRPFVEISFMPKALADGEKTVFWYEGNISRPKCYVQWGDLITKLVSHLVNRYGVEEVSKWYFEVWNEPDLMGDFFDGDFNDYMMLYKTTVRAIKDINSEFKVGGPSSSSNVNGEPPWIKQFLCYCSKEHLPVDFISTHPYPNNYSYSPGGSNSRMETFMGPDGTKEQLLYLKKIVRNCGFSDIEILANEWNASATNMFLARDTAFMASFVIQNNIKCIGLADALAFWAFSDIFEEHPPEAAMFHGGYGLINRYGLRKPSYIGYWFLARLGDEILTRGDNFIVTRKDDKMQVLLWNYVHYNKQFAEGERDSLCYTKRYEIFEDAVCKTFNINIQNPPQRYRIKEYVFDRQHGSIYEFWLQNGAVEYPSRNELSILNQHTFPCGYMRAGRAKGILQLNIVVQPFGVVLLEIKPEQ